MPCLTGIKYQQVQGMVSIWNKQFLEGKSFNLSIKIFDVYLYKIDKPNMNTSNRLINYKRYA